VLLVQIVKTLHKFYSSFNHITQSENCPVVEISMVSSGNIGKYLAVFTLDIIFAI
jgi:hypothetical protein